MNTFIFDTEAQYLTSKASGDVKTALGGAEVSRSAVSFCKDTGKTYVDAINVIVERKDGGELGDCLLYKTSNTTYYWLKSCKALSVTEKGGQYMDTVGLTKGGYVRIGIVIKREGDNVLLMSCGDLGSFQWIQSHTLYENAAVGATNLKVKPNSNLYNGLSVYCGDDARTITSFAKGTTYDTITINTGLTKALTTGSYVQPNVSIPNCYINGSIRSRQVGGTYRDTRITAGGIEAADEISYNRYGNPCPRTYWDACVQKIMANEEGSGEWRGSDGTGGNWSVTPNTTTGIGDGTIVITNLVTATSATTVNPKDYGYSFDKWYEACVGIMYPTKAGAMLDKNGRENTKAIITWAKTSGIGTPAATQCNNYAPTGAPAQFSAGQWWLPTIAEMWHFMRRRSLFAKKGITPSNYYWSSSQNSSRYSWFVFFPGGNVTSNYRFYSHSVRAVSAFKI